MEFFKTVFEFLIGNDILLYLGIVADGIASYFALSKKKVTQGSVADADLQALIDYHQKAIANLEKQLKKGG